MKTALTARQRELFNAILTDFLAHGFATFTIDNATKRYRCSKSTLYGLGDTRDVIIRRILVSFFKEVTRRTDTSIDKSPSYSAALENYFNAMSTALSSASPAFMRDLAKEPVAQDVFSINTQSATATIHRLLNAGVKVGEFCAESTAFVSQLIQRTMNDIQQGQYLDALEPTEAYKQFGAIILHGISHP